jgi:hypothetical protein
LGNALVFPTAKEAKEAGEAFKAKHPVWRIHVYTFDDFTAFYKLYQELVQFADGERFKRYPRALAVGEYKKAEIKAVCELLRDERPDLKVKRITEDGVPMIRLSKHRCEHCGGEVVLHKEVWCVSPPKRKKIALCREHRASTE